jgi:hypothetical protein
MPDFGLLLTVLGRFLSDKGDFVQAESSLREAETIFSQRIKPSI